MGRTIENIEVVDVEKRKVPSKHYVYIVHVEWSDQCINVIYRRYSRFFDFQSQLMDMFPEEAGAMDPSKRIIPFLPGKKFFGRSHIREVALKRMGPIAEYCKAIVKLPRKISQCRDVLEFFELEPDDIDPPKGRRQSVKAKKISQPKPLEVYIAVTEYKKQEKGEVTLVIGMLVEVVEKTETGWWFVNVEDEQGWVPSTCLEREDGVKEDSTVKFAPGEEEQYLCTEEFKGDTQDELSMEKGAVVDVIEKNLEGWWRVRYNSREGLVPATYLIKTNNVKIRKNDTGSSGRSPSGGGPVIVKTLVDVSDLLKDDAESNERKPAVPAVKPSSYETVNDDDIDDDDDGFDEDEYDMLEDKIYSIQEVSKILKEDKQESKETQKIYESLLSMKSRSLKRNGSTRPPPRPPAKPGKATSPEKSRPPLLPAVSVSKEYVTMAAFSDAVGDGISFDAGESVKVLEKSETGWWYIDIGGKEGWAPATYIESTTSVGDRPRASSPARAPSPVGSSSPALLSTVKKTRSPARSREDLTEDSDLSNRRNSSFGNLTNALKAKFKTNKSPPTLPKKDFLDDHEDEDEMPHSPKTPKSPLSPMHPVGNVRHSTPGGGTSVQAAKLALKKPADRNLQPPPPAPPVVSFNEKKAHSTEAANKPLPLIPPGKGGLKHPPVEAKPKPPVKTVVEPSSDDTKPSPFNVVLKHTGGHHKVESKPEDRPKPKPLVPKKKDTKSVTDIVKPPEPVKHDIRPMDFKPKPPVKTKPPDVTEDSVGKVDVAGLAGALKAKFEAGNIRHSAGETEKSNPGFGMSNNSPKPLAVKPNKPETQSKPLLVPKPGHDKPGKPSWVKDTEPAPPQPPAKPSCVKNAPEVSSKHDSKEQPGETHKVSALADMLKAKFENKPQTEPAFDNANRASRPSASFDKSPVKKFDKPMRPSTPPTKRPTRAQNTPPNVRTSPRNRPDSAMPVDSSLDPKKYSSRPLPPAPGKAPSSPNKSNKPLPNVPVKSKTHFSEHNTCSSDSDDDARPVGVSNLANVLKSRLGAAQNKEETKHNSPSVAMKPKINAKPEVNAKTETSQSDIENNNANTEDFKDDNMYCAVADFAGSNDGEIELVSGQYYNLLETADGWWYVSSGNEEGWAPSTYLEEVGSSRESERNSEFKSNPSQQSRLMVTSDFDAENDGELSVKQGEMAEVIDSPEGGWWYVKVGHNEGWIPASFLSDDS